MLYHCLQSANVETVTSGSTYTSPSRIKHISCVISLLRYFVRTRSGNGIDMSSKLVKMLAAAVEYRKAFELMQVPGFLGVQDLETGTQANMLTKVAAV